MLAQFAGGGQAVHFRHHHVHQDEVDRLLGRRLRGLERGQRLLAVAGDLDDGAQRFEDVGDGVDIAHVVLDDQDATAFQHAVAALGFLQQGLLFRRQFRHHLV